MTSSTLLRTVLPLGLGVIAVWGAIIVPAVISINSMTARLGEERTQLERRYLQQQDLRRTVENLNEIRTVAAHVSDYAIREGDELRFIRALEDAATARAITQDLRLQTAQQQRVTDWETTIPIALTVRGSYTNVARYLRDLEALSYLVHLDSIQVQDTGGSARTATSGGTVEVRANGHVHWMSAHAPAFLSSPAL